MVKNPLAKQEIWVQSLDWEDPLEKEIATHSSILAWEIPWTREPGGLQSMGSQSQKQLSDLTATTIIPTDFTVAAIKLFGNLVERSVPSPLLYTTRHGCPIVPL